MNAAAPPKANKAEDDFLKASKDASTYFERFDKSSLHDAASRRSTDWLLSEEAVVDAPDFFVPMIKGLQEPPDDQGYCFYNTTTMQSSNSHLSHLIFTLPT